jgi:hypothetical protein
MGEVTFAKLSFQIVRLAGKCPADPVFHRGQRAQYQVIIPLREAPSFGRGAS